MSEPLTIFLFERLTHLAIASFVMLSLATIVILLLREPARRVRIIQWTLGGLVILPAISLAPGYPRWSIVPNWSEAADRVDMALAEPHEVPAMSEPVAEAPLVAAPIDSSGVIAPPSDDAQLPLDERPVRADVLEPTTTRLPVEAAPILPRRAPSRRLGDLRAWVVAVYLVGAAVMALWSLLGMLAARRLVRSARPADERCRRLLRELAGPKSHGVALVVSARTRQPCVVAWRPTTIVLSESLCSPENEQSLRWALAHEWSHVAHGDAWTWLLASVVRWLYFYQPPLWWLRRHLQLCQDYVADSQAARAGTNAEDYAEFLTSRWLMSSQNPLAVGLGIGGRGSDLTRRIIMLVERPAAAPPLETASPRRWNLAVVPVAVAIIATLGALGKDAPSVAAQADSAPPAKTEVRQFTDPNVAPNTKYYLLERQKFEEAKADARPAQRSATDDSALDATIEAELNKAPLILKLTQILSYLEKELMVLRGQLSDPNHSEEVKKLQWQILEYQEKLEETKANLRPKIIAMKTAEQRSQEAQTARAPNQKPEPRPFWARRGDPSQPFKLEPGDIVHIEVDPEDVSLLRSKSVVVVEPSGKLPLGPRLGRVQVGGKTLEEAEAIIVKVLEKELNEPKVQLTYGGRSVDGTASAESATLQSLRQEIEELKRTIRDMRAGKSPAHVVPLERK